MARFDIVVLIRRGAQPAYAHTAYAGVRPAKVARLLNTARLDTASNLTRGFAHELSERHYARGTALQSGTVRAVVYARPKVLKIGG